VKERKLYRGGMLAAIVATSAMGYFAAPASANPNDSTTQPLQLAASDSVLVAQAQDLCRKVSNPPDGLIIRSGASTTSSQVGGVGRGATVTLTTAPPTVKSDAAKRKWVEISAPKAGWISNGFPGDSGHLVMCSGAKPPETPKPPAGSTCRRVIRPNEGLLIRSDANMGAKVLGGVGLNQRVTLTSDPATTKKDSQGRSWIQISAPTAGWISNGFGTANNTGACP
jgi:Bacterial SH3 domain